MNSNKLLSQIEALLFVAGDEGMTVKQLAQYIDMDSMDIEAGLSELQSQYNEEEKRGITLKHMAGTYQLTTKPEVSDTLKKLIENPTNQVLTSASLEVLAIIAYKQPITRAEVEDLRGVKSERPIATLVSRALVQEVGRAEGTGRAILYGTTKEFLNYFGLKNIKELPPLPDQVEQDDEQPTDLFLTKFQETFNQN
ncbi:SMC-Scp complex subunit ScpB [Lysinibacillus sp. 2017]|uniref:SMC-Scp complex subunit ScpB n=1 Tax=unclassified Lysinibacillus TaxID=2636778 RepID=UPI000D526B9B|nr:MULTISPECIES: SMC-Scp complex subunit ScpB [unclassified Lysinibacillus]AWE06884.1 SMC-Scp complex subunit ScpB [Lysinibacillus sp. 2017]TGN37185.1 SMC-Scp complex subunit ScpB [Lysinibacillus sp. S2017]